MKRMILTVDDEKHILELLKYTLEEEGFVVWQAAGGEEALKLLKEHKMDAVVLDLMLPGMDGMEVLKRIRSDSALRRLPVLMLTAKSDELDRVMGLEMGADDYLCKPFFVRELIARIKAILRRTDPKREEQDFLLKTAGVLIDTVRHTVIKDGRTIELTRKEFDLLCLLVQGEGQVITRKEILAKIWGYDYAGETRTVDVHIGQLRKKLGDDQNFPRHIITVRGVGYKWKEE